MALQHLRSSTANKRPLPAVMADGQLAANTNTASPGLFFKDSAGELVKLGPVHVGTAAPNASPAAGGETGNTTGELWLDTSVTPNQLKTWNGSAWVSDFPDEIPVAKLADGAARQLLQTDAAGTGVEWTSNVDVPGTLDVTGATTLDSTLTVPLGSAASPTLRFSGDANSGLYSPGADQVAVATNGTGRLFVDSAGKVGIGTSSPQAVLESKTVSVQPGDAVYAKKSVVANIPYSTNNITSSALAVYDGTIHAADIGYSYDGSGYYLALGTSLNTASAPTERVRIDRLGNVGIGTTNPQEELHIASASQPYIQVQSTGGVTGSAYYGYNSSTGSASIESTGSIRFAIPGSEAARFDTSGRLLVGTSTSVVVAGAEAVQQIVGTPTSDMAHRSSSGEGQVSLHRILTSAKAEMQHMVLTRLSIMEMGLADCFLLVMMEQITAL
jgi:hypothetical protein